MQKALETAMVDAEVIRQEMLGRISQAIKEIMPMLLKAVLYAPDNEREAIAAEAIGAVAADVIQEFADELESNAEATVASLTAAVTSGQD